MIDKQDYKPGSTRVGFAVSDNTVRMQLEGDDEETGIEIAITPEQAEELIEDLVASVSALRFAQKMDA